MANELMLKYGCNPNQKPSKIFMKDGGGAAHHRIKRQAWIYQLFGCFQLMAAGKGAEAGHWTAGSGFL